MHFDRLFCDKEFLCDVAVPVSSSDLAKHLHFAVCEGFIGDVLSNLSSNFGWNTLLAAMHLADYFQQFLRRHALQHVAASPGLKCALDFNIPFERSEHDDAGIRKLGADCYHYINAIHVR